MRRVVGVRFKPAGKIFHFDPGRLEVKQGEHVIVDTVRGMECGLVVCATHEINENLLKKPLKFVQRIATTKDLERVKDNHAKEEEAFKVCLQKIKEHNLPMKLLNVECTFNFSKLIFSFMAEERVDFRALVKDLASTYHTRIELRQIGVRDQAKKMGGVGCCGRPLCCSSFLENFVPVSIHMAKTQNLSLNPTKISGICGRLLCCLKYEDDLYKEMAGDFLKPKEVYTPKPNDDVVTEYGEGRVISVTPQRKMATVLLNDKRTIVVPWSDLETPEIEVPPTGKDILSKVDEDEAPPDLIDELTKQPHSATILSDEEEPKPNTRHRQIENNYHHDLMPKQNFSHKKHHDNSHYHATDELNASDTPQKAKHQRRRNKEVAKKVHHEHNKYHTKSSKTKFKHHKHAHSPKENHQNQHSKNVFYFYTEDDDI